MAKMKTRFDVTNEFAKKNPVGCVYIMEDDFEPHITVDIGGIGGSISGQDLEQLAVNILKALQTKQRKRLKSTAKG